MVGCGHAGCYTMEVAKSNPHLFDKIMLANFGYLGPFTHVKSLLEKKGKTKMIPYINFALAIFNKAFSTPIIGPIIYYLMTTRNQLKGQLKSHVFAEEKNITPEVIKEMTDMSRMKRPLILLPAFMLGHMDPYTKREQMVDCLKEIDK